MTRVNVEQQKHTPWFAKAGAACSIVPLSRFVGSNIFALKGGGYPFARLCSASGQPFASAAAFHAKLLVAQRHEEQQRSAVRLSFAARPLRSAPVTLCRFRTSLRYAGRPAAADMAFCIAACAQGWTPSDIAAALRREYLSRNASESRQAGYIRRTISKAMRWAA